MKDFFRGLLYGGLTMVLIVVVLIFISRIIGIASADEAVPVREATLSERHHSYNYTIADAARDRVDNLEIEVIIVVQGFTDSTSIATCAQTNARLTFVRERIIKYQQRTPKYAYVYQEVLDLIKEQWCYDDNH